uniref:GRF-type domain-containing protein n=1 Tax=Triticum urartu TaxID=4572 RepID=A0A8R7V4E7_TRIUA
MSWSLGGSFAPGFRRASGRRDTDARSSVRYREQPMAYEPVKLCHCNPRRKAPRWISCSRQNPGRRYYACVNAMHGGCGYAEWHDDPLPKFFSDLIG